MNNRKFPSRFIPTSYELTKKYGALAARVYGQVWLYEGGSDGVCRATIERIARDLDASYSVVQRALSALCSDGYLLDLTPGVRNKPHAYKTTSKLEEETTQYKLPSARYFLPTSLPIHSVKSTDEEKREIEERESRSSNTEEQRPAGKELTGDESNVLGRLETALGYKIVWKQNRSKHAKFLLAEESNGYSVEEFTKNLPDERRAKVARFEEDLPEDWKRYGRLRSVAHYIEGV